MMPEETINNFAADPEFSFIENLDLEELRFELKERVRMIYELREQRDTLIKTLSIVVNR